MYILLGVSGLALRYGWHPAQQLTYMTANVEDGARLDIAANGFWGGRYERTFIDVRIFNPHAPSNRNSDPPLGIANMRGQRRGPMSKE